MPIGGKVKQRKGKKPKGASERLTSGFDPIHACIGERKWKELSDEERAIAIASKYSRMTWIDFAKRLDVSTTYIWRFRTEHPDLIDKVSVEIARQNRHKAYRSLTEIIENTEHKDVLNAIRLNFDIFGTGSERADEADFWPFHIYYPQHYQSGFLYHRDYSYGHEGNDQLLWFNGGAGSGKTATGANKALQMAKINRGVQGLICGPTYSMLDNPGLAYFEAEMDAAGVPYVKHKTDHFYRLWGDTDVLFRSFEDVDRMRGIEVGWAWVEELREGTEYDLNVIMTRVRNKDARFRQVFVTSTPFGFNFMYDVWANPESKTVTSGQAVMYTASSRMNRFIPSAVISGWENMFDEQFAAQEIDAKFVNMGSGLIYHKFDRKTHVKKLTEDKNREIWIGQDFNFNPMCSVIMQPIGDGVVNILSEVHLTNCDTDELVKHLVELGYGPSDRITLYPDATGNSKSSAAGTRTPITILKNAGYNVYPNPSNPRVRDRYAVVNARFRNANGDIRLFVDESCRYLIQDFEREIYKEGSMLREEQKDGAKMRGHLSDAAGYPLYHNFPFRLD